MSRYAAHKRFNLPTPADRIEADRIRQQEVQRKQEEMAKQQKSPMGFARKRPDRSAADDAVKRAHHAVTDALSSVEEAMRRERTLNGGEQAERDDAARRQPHTRGRR